MAQQIPDLWRLNEDARRLYELYLCRLEMHDFYEDVVSACRQIRRYASRGPGPEEGAFTFDYEIDSLCELERYEAAWRQLRLREELAFGKRLDLERHRWSLAEAMELRSYPPLLFFLSRYRQGCSLFKKWLGLSLRGPRADSYPILFDVYNGEKEPSDRYRVTLAHFYERLGKDLTESPNWKAFVNGFHPRLFRLSGVRREEVLADSESFAAFFDRLMKVGERETSKRQEFPEKKLAEFDKRNKANQQRIEAKLQTLFPELRGLPAST